MLTYYDSGEWINNNAASTFQILPSTEIIGYQVPDEVLLFTRVISSNSIINTSKTSFIQIFP